ncbi:unnamed protein product [Cochlearia groenlandica]
MTLLLLNPFPFSYSSRLLLIFFVSKRISIVESAENGIDIDTGAAKLKKVTSNKEYGIECKLLEIEKGL